MFGKHFDDFESLEIVNEDVGKPEIVDEVQVHWDKGVSALVELAEKVLGNLMREQSNFRMVFAKTSMQNGGYT